MLAANSDRGSPHFGDRPIQPVAASLCGQHGRDILAGAPSWPDVETCRREVFKWILRYNNRRRHSACGYLSPVTYEQTTAPLTYDQLYAGRLTPYVGPFRQNRSIQHHGCALTHALNLRRGVVRLVRTFNVRRADS